MTKISTFQSMPNFRVIDSCCSESVKEKETCRLYRSSRPDFLTAAEIDSFMQLGIRSVIDFRSVKEYHSASGSKLLDCHFPLYKVKLPLNFKYRHGDKVKFGRLPTNWVVRDEMTQRKHFLINFFTLNYIWAVYGRAPWYIKLFSLVLLLYDIVFNTGYRHFVRLFARHVLNKCGLAGQYIDMVTYSQAAICSALKLLTDPRNTPAMLNCAHGKDRTGVVSALILACLGKSKEYIAEEYAKSESQLGSMKEKLHDDIVNKFHLCKTFTSAKAETMMQVLEHIEKQYGSPRNYLESIGFGAEEQEKLRHNLLSCGTEEVTDEPVTFS